MHTRHTNPVRVIEMQAWVASVSVAKTEKGWGRRFRFWPRKDKTRAKKWRRRRRKRRKELSLLSSPPPLRSFTRPSFCAVFDSRSSFFAPKPHGNACYAGYWNACLRNLESKEMEMQALFSQREKDITEFFFHFGYHTYLFRLASVYCLASMSRLLVRERERRSRETRGYFCLSTFSPTN